MAMEGIVMSEVAMVIRKKKDNYRERIDTQYRWNCGDCGNEFKVLTLSGADFYGMPTLVDVKPAYCPYCGQPRDAADVGLHEALRELISEVRWISMAMKTALPPITLDGQGRPVVDTSKAMEGQTLRPWAGDKATDNEQQGQSDER